MWKSYGRRAERDVGRYAAWLSLPNPNCRKEFRVMDEALNPPDVDEQHIDVKRPHSQTSYQITWPRGHKYLVIPK